MNTSLVQNGSFVIVEFDGKYLFLEREQDGLLDIPGGGYELTEVNYRKIAKRELFEETNIDVPEASLLWCATLGQKLKKEVIEKFGVEYGYVFLHKITLYKKPTIILSREHVSYTFLPVSKVLTQYKKFKSGPLWLFFTYLAFKETHQMQEGMIADRRFWKGKEYI
jgi:8-oxo-dGTP pyrophosphatase MutT (NUDIX family)